MKVRAVAALAGLIGGLAVGVVTGAVDLLIRASVDTVAFGRSAALGVVALYGVVWALLGLVSGAVFAPVRGSHVAGWVASAALVVAGGYGNIFFLPSLFAPASLLFDLVVVAAALATWWWVGPRLPAMSARAGFSLALVVIVAVTAAAWTLSRTADGARARATSQSADGPNVVILLLDALRADHTPIYGYARDTTPNLAAFAAEGLVYEEAYAQSSWTKPSVSTLFTGVYPESHGTHAVSSRLPTQLVTLPEVMRGAGYRTAVFAENSFVSPLFGFDRGVDQMVANEPDVVAQTTLGHLLVQVSVRFRPAQALVDVARLSNRLDRRQRFKREGGMDVPASFDAWLEEVGDEPFFAYLHLMKPHAPYICPEPFDGTYGAPAGTPAGDTVDPPHVEGIAPFATTDPMSPEQVRALIDNYDERIRFGDHMSQQILQSLRTRGLYDSTAVLLIADHGEEFGEHGLFDHGHSLQEGVVRVPFVVRFPARVAAGRSPRPVRLLDVPPTVLDLAGLASHPQFEGRSVLSVGREERPRPVLSQLRHGSGYWSNALVSNRLKLIQTQMGQKYAAQVFDLTQDPGEDANLAVSGQPPLTVLELEMEDAILAAGRQRQNAESVVIDPETQERLRALGYIQ